MQINLIEMWARMGLPVKGVVVLLTLQAIACIAVTMERLTMITRSRSRSERFVKDLTGSKTTAPQELLAIAERHAGSHLADFVRNALTKVVEVLQKGNSIERAVEVSRRTLERKVEPLSRDLNSGMAVLASVGSTAPFVGLLGTVLGIINAFKMIATTGSGGIGAIGSAIGEALIVTGYGLVVAIPTVLLFNGISSRIAGYEGDIVNGAGDLLDQLELNGSPSFTDGAPQGSGTGGTPGRKRKLEARGPEAVS